MNRQTRGGSQEVVNKSDGGAFPAVDSEHVALEILGTQSLIVVKVHSSGRCVECLKGVIHWRVDWQSSHFGIV